MKVVLEFERHIKQKFGLAQVVMSHDTSWPKYAIILLKSYKYFGVFCNFKIEKSWRD